MFEPIYWLEASRNSEMAGTDLGQSIACNIAQLHSDNLELRSLPERGRETISSLPRTLHTEISRPK